MKASHAKKMAEQAFNKLAESVEAGKSEKLTAYLKAMARFHNYSLGNAILINFQRSDATHVAGFRTWQKLGRYVKAGSKGIAIMAPIVWRKRVVGTKEQEDDDKMAVVFRTAYVFDINQTEGKPLPEFARVRGDPADCTDRLEEFISGQDIKIEYSEKLGFAEGVSCGGTIKVKKGLTAAETFSILVHELSHELLHRDKDKIGSDRNVREIEAEAVAFVVSEAIGLCTGTASSDYVQIYNGDKKKLFESLERIQKTASRILSAIMADKKEYTATIEGQRSTAQAAYVSERAQPRKMGQIDLHLEIFGVASTLQVTEDENGQ